jgi:RecA-family ATPase
MGSARTRHRWEGRGMTDPKGGFGTFSGKARGGGLSGAKTTGPNGVDPDHELPVIPWIDECLSDYHGRELSPRLWVVPEWIPREQVTGLYGVGGINKTDFLIQLLLAKSRGLIFLEYILQAAPVYGLFCEDTREEIVRRATRIADKAWGLALADFPDFHFASLVGVSDKEFVTFDNGEMRMMQALYRVDQRIKQLGAELGTLDTLPHFYGGNEVHRRDVTRFITKLDSISIGRGCGILFTAHPSQRGKQSGSMDSGSTGWEGSVRARLALEDPGPEGTAPDDPTP